MNARENSRKIPQSNRDPGGLHRCTCTTPDGKSWSMVAQGDRILALDERGELSLIRTDLEKFELLSDRKVSESPTWGHIAISGNEIFIRELQAIAAWEWK